MKLATLIGGTLAAVGVAAAAVPANAAPTGSTSAEQVVMQLQARGNTVVVNRTGNLPLSECTIAGVRAGQTYARYDSGYPGAQNDPMRTVKSMTVYVDANC